VYGAIRSQTGTQPNEFTFTGEQVDASGLEYLRARYYDQTTGLFLGRDPLPLLRRYAYVGENPVNLTDPSGLWPCPGCGKIRHAIASTDDLLSSHGAELSKRLNQLAFDLDLAAAAALDTGTGAFCSAAVLTGVGVAACPVVYAIGVVIASPVIISSNVISAISAVAGCYGTLGNEKGGGVSFRNVKNCAVSAVVSGGGLFVADPNISALLNGYTVCRDRGRCTLP
jgi:RHS repeat-associated protein